MEIVLTPLLLIVLPTAVLYYVTHHLVTWLHDFRKADRLQTPILTPRTRAERAVERWSHS